MTIAIAWTRRAGAAQELVVASDSRLSGGGHVDVCQKIFPLDRGDSFLAFCGDTLIAFPLMFQIESAIANFQRASDRTEDTPRLLKRILLLLNSFMNSWQNADEIDRAITTEGLRFLFGGWSWRACKFVIYPIHFNKVTRDFRTFSHSKQLRRLGLADGESCYVIGDYAADFRHRLRERLRDKDEKTLDYEPLDVLAGMLSEEKFVGKYYEGSFFNPSDRPGLIGGSPQAAKVYQHSNIRPIAVKWPIVGPDKKTVLFGRPLFDWERTLNPIFDFEQQLFIYPLSSVSN